MASEADTRAVTTGRGVFAEAYCELLLYICYLKPEEFRVTDFLDAVGPGAADAPFGRVTCAPDDPQSRYHLHVSWRKPDTGEFTLRVEFIEGAAKKDPAEHEPFAEGFLRWLNQFFVAEGLRRVHTHADFEYPSKVRSVQFFPLPMKTAIAASKVEIEIDGISFTITEPINGVEKLWLTQRKEELAVRLVAERQIDFLTFNPAQELAKLSEAIDRILGKEQQ